MKTLPEVDAVIAGGGWAGLLMAKELGVRTSMRVVVLERGGPRKNSDYVDGMDELDNAIRFRMMQDPSRETVTFRHNSSGKALPMRQFASFLPGTGVGGAGEHWNGMLFRFQPDAFELVRRTVERYGASKMPEGHSCQDWGIRYDELEPYYSAAESLVGASGETGANPFEGARSAPFPTPPMKPSYFNSVFRKAAESLGYHPYSMPSANLSQAYRNPDGVIRAGCQYCGFCERFGCMVGAKAQPVNTLLPVIQKRKNVELRTDANVRRITHEGGKATGVTYVNQRGEEFFQPARKVFLASWTLSNTRLLLLSKLGRPYDPATGKGVVGRNLTHQAITISHLFFDKPLNAFMGSGADGIAMADFDGDNFDHSSLDFIRGGNMFAVTTGLRPIANFGVIENPPKRNWGAAWKKAAIASYDHVGALQITGEHLSYRANYMDLDPTYRDAHGDPLLRMTIDWQDNEHRLIRHLSAKLGEIGKAMGARTVRPRPFGKYDANTYRSTHIQGGTIMGNSPETSVVNTDLQMWDAPNVYLLGASAFPQNASGNPTLTVMALVLRTANHIIRPGM